MKRVLLGLGSNKAFEGRSPHEILRCACSEIERHLSGCSFSSVYKTRAMYVDNQDDFYNMAALGYVADETDAFDFLTCMNTIEAMYGRDRSKEIRFGPRTLDIDIELFGDEVINHPVLQIPHPRIAERAFVLVPAIEILTNSADVLIREKYISCLERLTADNGSEGIIKLGGWQNGDGADRCNDKTRLQGR